MRAKLEASNGQESEVKTAEIDHGRISFRRSGPDEAQIEVGYEMPAMHVDLSGKLASGIDAVSEYEIENVRKLLLTLGDELGLQLSNRGHTPALRRTWSNSEDRLWHISGDAFYVNPTRTHHHERLSGYEGAADAHLVQEFVRLFVEQRVENIRHIYQKVLVQAESNDREPSSSQPLVSEAR